VCTSVPGAASVSVLRWLDEGHLVTAIQDSARREIFTIGSWEIEARHFDKMLSVPLHDLAASPNGRWIAYSSRMTSSSALRWTVVPLAHPDLAREVVGDRLGERQINLAWAGRASPTRYVARLTVDAPTQPLPLSVSSRLRGVAHLADGRIGEESRVRWKSLTPAIAEIDSLTGILHPMQKGIARIAVSVGGWISETNEFRIADRAIDTLLTEDWSRGIEKTFIPYGDPRPSVGRTTFLSRGLLVNGDGSFTSGVYSRDEFSAERGLGVEAIVSTPIDSMQWQTLALEITAELEAKQLSEWDHRTEAPPNLSAVPHSGRCAAFMPAGEGPTAFRQLGGLNGETTQAAVPDELRSGRPYRLLVQLFPDGRCGIAINGKPLAIVNGQAMHSSHYRVVFYGRSVKTKIAFGPLTIWSGVRPGVDWWQARR